MLHQAVAYKQATIFHQISLVYLIKLKFLLGKRVRHLSMVLSDGLVKLVLGNSSRLCLLVVVPVMGTSPSGYAADVPLFHFSIPAQRADISLTEYAQITGRKILFPYDLVKRHQLKELKGDYSADEAVAILLDGSDLRLTTSDQGSLIIKLNPTWKIGFMKKYTGILAGIAASLAGAPEAVFAQDSGGALEEIVVTARKRAENLQDTPISISAFSSESLQRRQINSTDDLDKIAPNLQFATYGPLTGNSSASQVFIRGIGQTDATASVDPGVGLYIDDVYMGSSVGGAMDFRDISNIQVLRGPQGTLFGRNTIGGAVLLSTTKPGEEFGGTLKVGVGDDSLTELQAAVDVPLSENLTSRFTYGSRTRDGYVFRADGTDLGDEDTYTLTGKLLFIGETFDVMLKVDYTEEDENGAPLVFQEMSQTAAFPAALSVGAGCPGATFPPLFVPADVVNVNCANTATWDQGEYINGGTVDLTSTLENSGIALIANLELSDSVSLKSVTSYRETQWEGIRDADNTGFVILHTDMESDGDQFSQEFQFTYNTDRLNALVGFFYFDSTYDETLIVNFTPPPAQGSVVAEVNTVNNGALLGSENWAVFSQVTYDITDQLSLTAGVRYTDETKSAKIDAFGGPSVVDSNGDLVAPFGLTQVFAPASEETRYVDQANRELEFSNTSGHLNIQYRLAENFMTYFSYSEAFKSGGWNPLYNFVQPEMKPTSFDEELAESIEIGFKSDVTDSLRINGAIFSTDYTDMQFTFRVGIVPLLFNAGEASIEGAELEFTFAPNDRFILEGGFGYLDAEVDSVANITSPSSNVTAVVQEGNKLPYTPELSASLGASYAYFLSGWRLTPRIDLSYTDEQFFDAGNSVEIAQQDAELTARMAVTLEDDDYTWRIVAGVDNLTDSTYPVAGNSSLTTSTGYAESAYSRPRTWYVNAEYTF